MVLQASNHQHKLLSTQVVKSSYNCMLNMAQAMCRHNVKDLKDGQPDQPPKQKPVSKLGGGCLGGYGNRKKWEILTDHFVFIREVYLNI